MSRRSITYIMPFVLLVSACSFDPSGLDPRCGNGVAEPGEECDGTDLGGHTCQDFHYQDGELSCSSGCTLVLDACIPAKPECGNGVHEIGEECDGTDVPLSCQDMGYTDATMLCTAGCLLDVTQCHGGSCDDGDGLECTEGVRVRVRNA